MDFKTPRNQQPRTPNTRRDSDVPSLAGRRSLDTTSSQPPRPTVTSRRQDDRTVNPLRKPKQDTQSDTQVQKVIHRIEIKFLFPQFAKDSFKRLWAKLHFKTLLNKLGKKRIGFGLLAIVMIFAGYTMYKQLLNRPIEVTQDLGNGVTKSKIQEKPDYDTVVPSGKTITQLGGWTRVSPPYRNPVFAYADTIGKIPINVSQQPIPKDAKSKDDFVATLAKAYLANDKVTASDKTIFYVGTSAKGPQSIIFAKNNTLVLIRSSAKVEDTEWAKYISSLQ